MKAGVLPMPGVAGFPRPDGSAAVTPARHPLQPEVARFVGEPLAAVVALTREQARDALESIAIDFEELPTVTDAERAVAAGAPLVMPEVGDNIAAELRHGDAAASDKAFAGAAHVARLSLVNQRLAASPIEPRTALAYPDPATGRLTVRLSTQMPTGARETFCTVLGMEKEDVRVVVGDVGGGFGMKTGIYPEDAVVAFAAAT
jgi:carbon-monoxide dehydrogenase large subunit